jgi:hypothetical protein
MMASSQRSRALPRLCRSLCVGVALALAGCGGKGPAWQSFHSPEAGFSAEFPGQVSQPQGIEKSGAGGPQTYHFECRSPDGFTYQVTFVHQKNTDEQIAARLKEAEGRRWRPDDPDLTTANKRVQFGSISGIEQVGQLEKGSHMEFKRWRNFYSPSGDYYVSVDSVTKSDAYAPDVERFFNSFKIDSAK